MKLLPSIIMMILSALFLILPKRNALQLNCNRLLYRALSKTTEYLLVSEKALSIHGNTLKHLQQIRPSVRILPQKFHDLSSKNIEWRLLHENTEIDSTVLETQYLSGKPLPETTAAEIWNKRLQERLDLLQGNIKLGDGGKLQKELDTALAIVQRVAYVSRSFQYQHFLTNTSKSIRKTDATPVTIIDFAAQALIINALHKAFPQDLFIAEEDSELLRSNPDLTHEILDFIEIAIGETWSPEDLYHVLDLGKCTQSHQGRIWVLDPIDGTKGYITGKHYCIALALLSEGNPILSIMGCPNLPLHNMLNDQSIVRQCPDVTLTVPTSDESTIPTAPSTSIPASPAPLPTSNTSWTLPPSRQGCIFYAIQGLGAYARALSMPLGSGIEIPPVTLPPPTPSSTPSAASVALSTIRICAAAEASHTNTMRLSAIKARLQEKYPTFHAVQLHSQCKYSVVALNLADTTLRLPPVGYQEYIWDHIAGYHFLQELGGKMTDLYGNPLDFSQGRQLPASVTGIIASNHPTIHDEMLQTIEQCKFD